ncbi:MAG: YggS family pyridoxal phosphate-dependent enzyme [Hyphomicrobiales bacterium]|nr:YggS family pyridoxal phosphate-dependent enzyme [Hyphomicrobiales bacterium]MBV9114851.1 YggS family pyridoxal phosphate-dependent enzyme [Hyphomicrobiales bacterium]MBV9518873.1 YggS family pyridoxal phosphate-dependent enzyme [Hyphomicrobiales bacterium]
MSTSVKDRLQSVRASIEHAAVANGREAENITLVAVSKTIPATTIEPALAAGHRVFGENRVQEAKAKWPALKASYPDTELHLIGPLQTNKVRDALGLVDAIHSLDRESLAAMLAKEMARVGRSPKLFVEVNTGNETSKAGIAPVEADRFIETCRERHGLVISGLMCIPPLGEPASPHFTLLAKIAERNGLPLLSMGMSADYEEAIAHGATHIRVGTAIFGARA